MAEDVLHFIKNFITTIKNFKMNFRNLFTILFVALATILSAQVVRPTQTGRFDAVETAKLTVKGGVFTGKALTISQATAKAGLIPSALAVYNAINARIGGGTYTLPTTNPDTTTSNRTVIAWTGSGAGTDTATMVDATLLTTRMDVDTVVTDTANITLTHMGVTPFDFTGTQATFTVTLPASPIDGDVVTLTFDDIVTALTISGGSKTIRGTAATAAAVGTVLEYVYIGKSIGKWYRRL